MRICRILGLKGMRGQDRHMNDYCPPSSATIAEFWILPLHCQLYLQEGLNTSVQVLVAK